MHITIIYFLKLQYLQLLIFLLLFLLLLLLLSVGYNQKMGDRFHLLCKHTYADILFRSKEDHKIGHSLDPETLLGNLKVLNYLYNL